MATFCDIPNCDQPSFRTDKLTRKHYCRNHYRYYSTDLSKLSIVQKAIQKHKTAFSDKISPSKPKTIHSPHETEIGEGRVGSVAGIGENEELDKVKKAEMDLFWLTAEKELALNPHCAECGAYIPKAYYRAATAHCLSKRKEYGFPSVAANLINKLFLGAGCGCHSRYDRSWEDAAQMKVFPMAIEIFKKLYPLIAKSERKNIPEVFRQEIEP